MRGLADCSSMSARTTVISVCFGLVREPEITRSRLRRRRAITFHCARIFRGTTVRLVFRSTNLLWEARRAVRGFRLVRKDKPDGAVSFRKADQQRLACR